MLIRRGARFQPFIRKVSSRGQSSPSDYCVDLVKRHDYENFLCTLLLSGEVRAAAFALRAFNIEVSQAAQISTEKDITLMRLQWWTDSLKKIFDGQPPEQPVALALTRVVQKHNLLKRHLSRLIKARSDMTGAQGFANLEKMVNYAEETVSPVYYLILQSAGIQSTQADHAASHLGKAQGLTNLLRSIPHHTSSRQLLLPMDMLAENRVSQESILRQTAGFTFKDVVFKIASLANSHLEKTRSMRKDLPKEALPIFLPAVATGTYLERLRELDFDVFMPLVTQRNAHLGMLLLWRKFIRTF